MRRALALLFVFSACGAQAADTPDGPRPLVTQSCGSDTCGPTEACLTDWPLNCSVLSDPPSDCRPCAPGATSYRCPVSGCGPLPTGCTSCDCMVLPPECRCDVSHDAMGVFCHEP